MIKNMLLAMFRLVAVIGDLIISHSILTVLGLPHLVDQFCIYLTSLCNWGSSVAFFLPTLLVYYFFRLVTTILFGVSFSQLFVGLKSSEDLFFRKRYMGGIRVFIEILFLPLWFIELVVVLGKRTLKEVITDTNLTNDGMLFSLIGPLILIPVVSVLCILSPLISNHQLVDGVVLEKREMYGEKISNNTNFQQFKYYNSNLFMFSSFSSLDKGRFVLLPSFDIVQNGKDGEIVPYIVIYDRKNHVKGSLRIVNEFSFFELVEKSSKWNPFFKKIYPELANCLIKDRRYFQRDKYINHVFSKSLMTEAARREARQLVEDSFSLGIKNLFNDLTKYGPFVHGFVSFKNSLLDKISVVDNSSIWIMDMGGNDFLFSRDDSGGMVKELFFSLGTNNSLLIQLEFQNKNDNINIGETVITDFKAIFFGMITWNFDYLNVFSIPKRESEMNPMAITDFFLRAKLADKSRARLESYIYHYYFDRARDALKSKDEEYQRILLGVLEKIFFASKKMNSKKKVYKKSFINFIKVLKISLRNRDRRYYNY